MGISYLVDFCLPPFVLLSLKILCISLVEFTWRLFSQLCTGVLEVEFSF